MGKHILKFGLLVLFVIGLTGCTQEPKAENADAGTSGDISLVEAEQASATDQKQENSVESEISQPNSSGSKPTETETLENRNSTPSKNKSNEGLTNGNFELVAATNSDGDALDVNEINLNIQDLQIEFFAGCNTFYGTIVDSASLQIQVNDSTDGPDCVSETSQLVLGSFDGKSVVTFADGDTKEKASINIERPNGASLRFASEETKLNNTSPSIKVVEANQLPKGCPAGTLLESYLTNVEVAENLASECGRNFRVIWLDGQCLGSDPNYDETRLNASVQDDQVVGVTVEGTKEKAGETTQRCKE